MQALPLIEAHKAGTQEGLALSDAEKTVSTNDGNTPCASSASKTTLIIGYYALCSSTMLIINKVAVHFLPAPTFLLVCQLAASALAVKACSRAGLIEADPLEWSKIKRFCFVVVGFLGTIYANMKVLQHSNVETFITFRSSTPLVLSLCDYLFLGRTLPGAQSWCCLVALLMGAAGYVMVDSGFRVEAYAWLCLWYIFFVFDTVYVKHMCESVQMTNWGRVYYTNTLALPVVATVLVLTGEHAMLATWYTWSIQAVGPLLLSCAVGAAMSHSSYCLRDSVSATFFTIIGIMCKVLTVIINMLIWDKHASLAGIGFLLVCVVAGTFYQQAPKREYEKLETAGS